MIGVVIVGHGKLAKAYLEAVEHVVGEQPGGLRGFDKLRL